MSFGIKARSFARFLAVYLIPGALLQWGRYCLMGYRNKKRLSDNFHYDHYRFLNYASPFRKIKSQEQLRSYLTMLSHSIEKGLSLPNPRAGFGKEKVNELLSSLESYLTCYGMDPLVEAAILTVEAYVVFHEQEGLSLPPITHRIEALRSIAVDRSCVESDQIAGGVREFTGNEIREISTIDLQMFFEFRFSIRHFSDQPVDDDVIRKAIRIAQKAPSVCNRQSGRVYVFDNDHFGAKVLACQQGNLGFGHEANKILVITSELGSFLSVGERNQCWIDGGFFAMTLIYALHSMGLGTCCLNWSVEKEADLLLRSTAKIAPTENIIMLIAVGHLPDKLRIPCSQRKPLEQVVTFHTKSVTPDNF